MNSFCLDNVSHEAWIKFQEYAATGSRYELIQIVTSLLPHPFYIRRNTSDFKNLHQIFVTQEYQFLTPKLSSMLDLGGYIGLASLYAISVCSLQSVHIVEPDPDNFKILQLNTRPYHNIHCFNAAVWPHKTVLSLLEQRGGEWGSIYVDNAENPLAPPVKTYTPFELIDHIHDKSSLFIKIDIEGSEKQLFSDPNASSWLSTAQLISCELHDRLIPGCSNSFFSVMEQLPHMVKHNHGEYTYFTAV